MSISAIVIAKNAEKIIEKTLKSLSFADEVILIDIKSQDATLKKAKAFCNQIYKFPKDSKFVEPVRNFAFEKATKDWILILDADEEIPKTLAEKLVKISQNPEKEAYYLPRKNIVFNKWMEHTAWWPDYQLRFFKKGVISWGSKIHSQPFYKGAKIQKEDLGFIEAKEELAILHHNYSNTEEYLSRFNRYTNIEAAQNSTDKFEISSAKLLDVFKDDWFRRFFDKEGYKDGAHGLYLSTAQAIYQMTVQMKTWDRLENKKTFEKIEEAELIKSLKSFQKDLNYWIKDIEIKEKKGVSRVLAQIKRKVGL